MRRLPREHYQGQAFVHWSMTIADRKTGWLDDAFHRAFRELLAHVLHRYCLLCPVYCLMPDHLHLLWMGLRQDSDQYLAARFFRQHGNAILSGNDTGFQKQAWDVVLSEKERERDAFESEVFYIANNPARLGLVTTAAEWPFGGSLAVGYPVFDWRREEFREQLWKIYRKELARSP